MTELEKIGLIPRSIVRMLDRFYYQIYLGTAEPLVKQFRFSKYLLLTSFKSLFVVLFIPFFINIFTKIYVFRPLVEYFWDRKQTEIFLNYELQEKAFSEIRNFEEKMYFDYLIKTENFAEQPFFGPMTGHKREPLDERKSVAFSFSHSRLWPVMRTNEGLENYNSGIFLKPSTQKKELFEINSQSHRNFNLDCAKFSVSSLQDWKDFKLSLKQLPKYPIINGLNFASQTSVQDLDCSMLNLLLMDSLLHVKSSITPLDDVEQNGMVRSGQSGSLSFSHLPLVPFSLVNGICLEQNFRYNHFSFVSFPNSIAVESQTVGFPVQQPSILFNKNTESIFRQKTRELANHYNNESISAITNLLADFMGLLILLFLLINMKMSLMNTTAFLSESFFSLKDSKKAFLMLLFTDLLVGFHSPRGWEVIFHFLFEHFGLPENHNIIFLLVGTFPVLLDALFKYWIFRHLNRHSPATVATFQAMVE
uniref:Potassium/proton antiporter CemA n=1 Tax=Draparnaldia mutabilis TaxID=1683230 RepID=A0A6H1U697_9CHLO|nr:chloroplast envelope membrane protein [Draparnaldia mutabilis]